jgi:hypothetical protein
MLKNTYKSPENIATADLTKSADNIYDLLRSRSTTTAEQSFEETYKSAYSHGLEAIYALENVDLKTVRRIGENQPAAQSSSVLEKKPIAYEEISTGQLELDLGYSWREWIEPFVVQEPIQVLGLAKNAEKSLLDNGISKLGDLIGSDLRSFIFLKGMGQGHIDEVQQKLRTYLDGRPLKKAASIDLKAWIRSLGGAFDRKKNFVLMDSCGLSDWFSLTPAESVEVRRLSSDKREEWLREAREYWKSNKHRESVRESMRVLVETFIKPWMRRRMGFATKEEVIERLHKISDQPNILINVLQLFQDLYFEGVFPFEHYLKVIEDGLYAADTYPQQDYAKIVNKAQTYFYNPRVQYKMQELLSLLMRDFAKSWDGFSEAFIEKVMRISPEFYVRKGPSGQLIVRLS